jgi:hypothetical protein
MRGHAVSWRTEKIIEGCTALADEMPRAKRALVAARRSGRDVQFNAYLAIKRIKLDVAKPAIFVLDRLERVLTRG